MLRFNKNIGATGTEIKFHSPVDDKTDYTKVIKQAITEVQMSSVTAVIRNVVDFVSTAKSLPF